MWQKWGAQKPKALEFEKGGRARAYIAALQKFTSMQTNNQIIQKLKIMQVKLNYMLNIS